MNKNTNLIEIIHDFVKEHYLKQNVNIFDESNRQIFNDFVAEKSIKMAYLMNNMMIKELPIVDGHHAAKLTSQHLFLSFKKDLTIEQVKEMFEKENQYFSMSLEDEFHKRFFQGELQTWKNINFRPFHANFQTLIDENVDENQTLDKNYESISTIKTKQNSFYLNVRDFFKENNYTVENYAQFSKLKKAYNDLFLDFHQNDILFQNQMKKGKKIKETHLLKDTDFPCFQEEFSNRTDEINVKKALNNLHHSLISIKLGNYEPLTKMQQIEKYLDKDLSHFNHVDANILIKAIEKNKKKEYKNITEFLYSLDFLKEEKRQEEIQWLNDFVEQFDLIMQNDLFTHEEYKNFAKEQNIDKNIILNKRQYDGIFKEENIKNALKEFHHIAKQFQNKANTYDEKWLFSLNLNDETLSLYDDLKQHLKNNYAFLFDLNQHHYQSKLFCPETLELKSLDKKDFEFHYLFEDNSMGKVNINGKATDLTQDLFEKSHQFKTNADFLYPYLKEDKYNDDYLNKCSLSKVHIYNSYNCEFTSSLNNYNHNKLNCELDIYDNGIKCYQLSAYVKKDNQCFLKVASSTASHFGSGKGFSQQAYQEMAELAYENNMIFYRNLNDMTTLGRMKLSNKFKNIREKSPHILCLEIFDYNSNTYDKRDTILPYENFKNWLFEIEHDDNITLTDINEKYIDEIRIKLEKDEHLFIQANFDTIFYENWKLMMMDKQSLTRDEYTTIKKIYDDNLELYRQEYKNKYQQIYEDLKFLHNISEIQENGELMYKVKTQDDQNKLAEINQRPYHHEYINMLDKTLSATKSINIIEKNKHLDPLFSDKHNSEWIIKINKDLNILNQQQIKQKIKSPKF